MSKAQNNHQNSRLKQLLSDTDKAGADDFEREALEGFASLQNEEEALQLKAELDAEIGPAVFAASKKQNKRVYWMAAAALLMMVGFTVYFIQKDPIVAPQNLAEHKVEPPTEVTANPSNVLSDSPAALPREKAKTIKQGNLPTITKDDNQNTVKVAREAVVQNESNDESKKEEVVSVKGTFEMASAAPPQVNTAEADKAASSDNYKALEAENKKSNKAQTIAVANEPAAEARQKMAKANVEREALAKTPPTASAPTSLACDYQGGVAAFKKDADKVLKPLDLKALKLKGSIVLSPNKQVMNVTLTEKGDLNKRDAKKVMEALKALSEFELPNTGSADFYYYNFEYSN